MSQLIYYPGFEPQDLNWIKFALIYLDGISPVMPQSGTAALSETYQQLRGKTDLFAPTVPDKKTIKRAGEKAIREIETLITNNRGSEAIFGQDDILIEWRDPQRRNINLYHEKFSVDFFDFCIREGMATEWYNGIMVPKSLSSFYMTFLVNQMAEEGKGIPITDDARIDDMATFYKAKNIENDALSNAAIATVTYYLPTDIENIELDQIIDFRNRDGMKELRASFYKHFSDFFDALEQELTPVDYAVAIRNTNRDFVSELAILSASLGATILSAKLLLADLNPTYVEVTKQLLETITGSGVAAASAKRAFKKGNHKRNSRQFLSQVRKMPFTTAYPGN